MTYVARMETQNFTFTALGETESDALDALARGWEAHSSEYHVEMSSEQALEEYEAWCAAVPLGRCIRDHDLI